MMATVTYKPKISTSNLFELKKTSWLTAVINHLDVKNY